MCLYDAVQNWSYDLFLTGQTLYDWTIAAVIIHNYDIVSCLKQEVVVILQKKLLTDIFQENQKYVQSTSFNKYLKVEELHIPFLVRHPKGVNPNPSSHKSINTPQKLFFIQLFILH